MSETIIEQRTIIWRKKIELDAETFFRFDKVSPFTPMCSIVVHLYP